MSNAMSHPMSDLRLYLRYLGISIRGQMQHRASFFMMAAGGLLGTAMEYAAIVFLFDRFGNLRGWSLPQVGILYGMMQLSFALADAAARGFDLFPNLIRSGELDRLLLRPRDTALQVAGQEFTLMRVGRWLQGLFVLVWAAQRLELPWTPATLSLLVAAVLGGACMFVGLFVLQATLAFWTVETLEIMNTVTYGGTETGQYPLTIYRPWFRGFFTWVVPLACANYLPAQAIFGRPDPLGSPLWLQWLSPGVGVLFLIGCLQIWRFGIRHYCSTGS
jgi:ABC-2 type transport system permease protein